MYLANLQDLSSGATPTGVDNTQKQHSFLLNIIESMKTAISAALKNIALQTCQL